MRERKRILVIDDQQQVRDLLREGLETFGYEVVTADSAAVARELVPGGGFALALCDIDMPGEPGTVLLPWLRRQDPDLAVIMVTGVDDAATAVGAMLEGASDYVCKPFALPELRARTEQALDKRRLRIENRRYQDHLEQLVEERTRRVRDALEEIRQLNEELTRAYDNTLSALMIALDYRDNETQGHSLRVVGYADRLAREAGIGEPERTAIRRGAMLHDVGKIGIPDAILRKPGPLTGEERELMQRHPELGFELLQDIEFLSEPARIVLAHQENWDGSGYPSGLLGEEIPYGARVFAVADTLDAMTSNRPYRQAGGYEAVRSELLRCAGRQFDPAVVEAFLRVPPAEWEQIRVRIQRELAGREGVGIPPGLFSEVANRSRGVEGGASRTKRH